MIDLFRTWLPQIIGYAQDLHDGTLEKAWEEGDRSRTSVYYSGELVEQVYGDLDADNMMEAARQGLAAHPELVSALDGFLCTLKRLDEWIEAHVDTKTWGEGQNIPSSVSSIFKSQEWVEAHSAAAKLVSVAGPVGFSGNDFDPTQTLH